MYLREIQSALLRLYVHAIVRNESIGRVRRLYRRLQRLGTSERLIARCYELALRARAQPVVTVIFGPRARG